MPGPRYIGSYRVERVLGSGSFATVWLARDERLDALVAIKVLADNWARHPEIRRRFVDEARLLRRLDDEHVVAVYTVDDLPDGRPYFVMSWADGGTLAGRAAERARTGGFSVAEAVQITLGIAEGLAVVHAFGVVHRDVKPSNVLFRGLPAHRRRPGTEERIVLGDFGLAKDLIAGSGFTVAAGTPAYMAPEQARASADIDTRADLYATGAVLYELLAGRPAFDADRPGTDPRSPPPLARLRADVPPGLDAVVARALSFDPADRFATAGDMAAALVRAAVAGVAAPGVAAAGVAAGGVASRPLPTHERTTLIGAVTALLAEAAAALADLADLGAESRALLSRRLRLVVIGEQDLSLMGPWPTHGEVDVAHGEPGTWPDADLMVVTTQLPPVPATPRRPGRATREPLAVAAVLPAGAPTPSAMELLPAVTLTAGPGARAALATWVDAQVMRWGPVLRARAALDLVAAVLPAATPPEAARRLSSQAELIRLAHPELDDLAVLQDEAAGRLRLPVPLRRELRRVLSGTSVEGAEGPHRGRTASQVAADGSARWRELVNSGRVPFAARAAAEAVARAYDRMASP